MGFRILKSLYFRKLICAYMLWRDNASWSPPAPCHQAYRHFCNETLCRSHKELSRQREEHVWRHWVGNISEFKRTTHGQGCPCQCGQESERRGVHGGGEGLDGHVGHWTKVAVTWSATGNQWELWAWKWHLWVQFQRVTLASVLRTDWHVGDNDNRSREIIYESSGEKLSLLGLG